MFDGKAHKDSVGFSNPFRMTAPRMLPLAPFLGAYVLKLPDMLRTAQHMCLSESYNVGCFHPCRITCKVGVDLGRRYR